MGTGVSPCPSTMARMSSAGVRWEEPAGRGLHSFTLELNLSNSGTHSRVKLGYTVDRSVPVELKCERE